MNNTEYPPHESATKFFDKRLPIGEYTWEHMEETSLDPSIIELLETPVTMPIRPQPIGTKIWLVSPSAPMYLYVDKIFDSNEEFEEFINTTIHPSFDRMLIMTTFVYPEPEPSEKELIAKLYELSQK